MKLVSQRGNADCGLAALATWLELPYEDVYAVVSTFDITYRGKSGSSLGLIMKTAAALGVTLRRRRKTLLEDMDHYDGVLVVDFGPRPGFRYHMVALSSGVVADPADGFVLPAEDYFSRFHCRPGTLLEVKP